MSLTLPDDLARSAYAGAAPHWFTQFVDRCQLIALSHSRGLCGCLDDLQAATRTLPPMSVAAESAVRRIVINVFTGLAARFAIANDAIFKQCAELAIGSDLQRDFEAIVACYRIPSKPEKGLDPRIDRILRVITSVARNS